MKRQQLWSLRVSLPDVGIGSDGWHTFVPRLPNIVLRGVDRATEKAVGALMPTLFKPIHLWCRGMPLSLPSERRGTLILYDVCALDADEQKKLLEWRDDVDGRVHVVSTASVPLFPLVESGLLLEHLLHWLTAIQVDVQVPNQHPQPTTSRQSVGFMPEQASSAARRR